MDNLRFFGLALGLFAAMFFGMKWLFAVQPLKPDPRVPTFQRVDTDDPRYKLTQSSQSDGDATRDHLRHEVLDYAKALNDDPCNDRLKARYIEAANNYARAWISIVPCMRSRTCGQADSKRLDLAQHAFGSPLDLRLREAMRQVHAKGIFKLGDFPDDTAFLVAELAADGAINPRAVHTTIKGPINADTPRAHTFESVRSQLGDTPQNVCGG